MKVRNKQTGAEFEVPAGTPPSEYKRFDPMTGRPKRPLSTDEQDTLDSAKIRGAMQAAQARVRGGFTERAKGRAQLGSPTPMLTEAARTGLEPLVGPKWAEGIATGVLPQSQTSYWMDMALALSGLGPIKKVYDIGRLGRIGLGTLTSTTAGGVSGEGAGRGFLSGLLSTAGGETAGKSLEWTARAVGSKFVRALDAKQLGDVASNVVKWLPKAKTERELYNLYVGSPAQAMLSEGYGRSMAAITQQAGKQMITVPSLNAKLGITAGGIPFKQVLEHLNEARMLGWTLEHKAKEGLAAQEARALWEEMRGQIPTALGPRLGGMWNATQAAYRKGQRIIELLTQPGAWITGEGGKVVRLNMRRIQSTLGGAEGLVTRGTKIKRSPESAFRKKFEESLTADEVSQFVDAVFRGGAETGRDVAGSAALHLWASPRFSHVGMRTPQVPHFAGRPEVPIIGPLMRYFGAPGAPFATGSMPGRPFDYLFGNVLSPPTPPESP